MARLGSPERRARRAEAARGAAAEASMATMASVVLAAHKFKKGLRFKVHFN